MICHIISVSCLCTVGIRQPSMSYRSAVLPTLRLSLFLTFILHTHKSLSAFLSPLFLCSSRINNMQQHSDILLTIPTVCLFTRASAASHGCTAACHRPLWIFQLWPPDAPEPTDPFRTLAAEVGTYGRRIRTGKFCLNADLHGTFRDHLHAANLRHGTHGFTSLP
jgi:hypothetical protein